MSVPNWRKTIVTSHLTARARLIALTLSVRMNGHGACYPSVATIAKDAGCSEMTVHRAIKELRDSAYLTVTYREKGPAKQQSNLYTLRIPPWRNATLRHNPDEDDIKF